MAKIDEDLRYASNEKLDGVEPRVQFKGRSGGNGITAIQKIYKWCSAVASVTLARKMARAMNPDKPKRVNEIAAKLEAWSA